MALTHPKSFYCPDERFLQFESGGFTYANTDGGILYWKIATSGGNLVIDFFKNDKMQSASRVATGTATLSTTDYLSVTVSAVNSSGLVFNALHFDDTAQDRVTDTGKVLVSLTMDSDFEVEEKTIQSLAPNGIIEGQGVSGCAFVRFHREATRNIVNELRRKLENYVGRDGRNMPNILDVVDIEQVKEAAKAFALSKIFNNYANGGDPQLDPAILNSRRYRRDYEEALGRVTFWIDRDGDGAADGAKRAGQARWR